MRLCNIDFIVLLFEHDLVPPVPELHRAVIAGGVEVSVLDLISPKKVINYHSEI